MKKEVQRYQKEMLEGERTYASQPARHPVDVSGEFLCLCFFFLRAQLVLRKLRGAPLRTRQVYEHLDEPWPSLAVPEANESVCRRACKQSE